ncbi:MAG: phosphodiesterase [Thermotogaceae bacterium]|nr:phosphodiesterase [Thermotogaceae bacterium]
MKIIVISDTHGSKSSWDEVKPYIRDADHIWHLGDVLYHGPRNPLPEDYNPKALAEDLKNYNIDYIRGNCDADVDIIVLGLSEMSRLVEEFIGNWKFVMIHGDQIEESDEVEFAKYHGAKILLRGHTHIPKIEKKHGIYVINPGSLSLPKGGYPKSFATLLLDEEYVTAAIYSLDGSKIFEEVLSL